MKAVVTPERCKSCGLCVVNCPQKALAITGRLNAAGYHVVTVDEERCIGCGICYTVCPDGVFLILEDEQR